MTDLPATMMVMAVPVPGGPDAFTAERRPVSMPGSGEVLIRVAAAGVNRLDAIVRAGQYPPAPEAPDYPGMEVAGVVVAAGEGADIAPGSHVCVLLSGGGYAEYAVAPAALCLPLPAGFDMVQAAAMPETLFTVWVNLFQRIHARAGETALVHGGGSGIGTMAISLCNLFGITVIVTCGSDEKCQRARDWGADYAINHRTQNFVDEVRRLTDGRGVDLVLDMVGGDYIARNVACMADDGRHASIAVLNAPDGTLNVPTVMLKRLTLTGSSLRPRPVAFKAEVTRDLREKVWPAVLDGRLRAAVDRCFPLKQVAQAHALLESGDFFGKIVLTTGPA